MSRHAATLEGPRVLVVDDNEVNRMVMERMLQVLELQTDSVDDGTLALEALSHTSYELVLMDLTMPGLDGLETTRLLRRLEADTGSARTTVVALTGDVSPESRRRCAAAGMDDFLAKPVELESLRALLDGSLRPDDEPRHGGVPTTTAAHAPGIGLPAVDVDRVQTLLDELGDESVVCELIETFCAELPARQQQVQSAGTADDLDAVAFATHALKSASALVGAAELSHRAAELEERARAGDLYAVRAMLDDLHAAAIRAREGLTALVAPQVS